MLSMYNANHVRFQKEIHLSNDNEEEGINVLMKKVIYRD